MSLPGTQAENPIQRPFNPRTDYLIKHIGDIRDGMMENLIESAEGKSAALL